MTDRLVEFLAPGFEDADDLKHESRDSFAPRKRDVEVVANSHLESLRQGAADHSLPAVAGFQIAAVELAAMHDAVAPQFRFRHDPQHLNTYHTITEREQSVGSGSWGDDADAVLAGKSRQRLFAIREP